MLAAASVLLVCSRFLFWRVKICRCKESSAERKAEGPGTAVRIPDCGRFRLRSLDALNAPVCRAKPITIQVRNRKPRLLLKTKKNVKRTTRNTTTLRTTPLQPRRPNPQVSNQRCSKKTAYYGGNEVVFCGKE